MNETSAPDKRGEEPARWSLRLFGGFELSVLPVGERVTSPGKRERALLAYLALSPKGREPRRKLATLIWGDATDETLLDNLRTCVWRLRKALGDTQHRLIASDKEDIVLNLAAFDVDVLAFHHLAAQSGRHELEAAANLCGGGFLDGLEVDSEEFESWRRAEAIRTRDQAVDVLSRLMKLLTECAETERAIEAGARILRLDPLHEATTRDVMKLYAESGRRGAAIHLYRTLAEALRADLNTQPEAETHLLFAEIARAGEEQPSVHDAPPSLNVANHADDVRAERGPVVRPSFGLRGPLAALAAALAISIALFSYSRLAPGPVTATPQTQQPGIAANRSAPIGQTAALTIAVLPFDNLSDDPGQQFFSDGMTEEITAALARIPDLHVVARASSFQFKGRNQDVRAIGLSLGVSHLIAGSVRKIGNRVRITAQLIRTDNGVTLWTDSYVRELTDVFAIQEDIAAAIAGALRVPLGLRQGDTLVHNRTNDADSYDDYLRAKALVRTKFDKLADAAVLLEQVVAREPDFAPAWAQLARAYADRAAFDPAWNSGAVESVRLIADASLPKAEAAGRRAIQLDPNLADGYLALGRREIARGALLRADEFYSKGLSLDPYSPDCLNLYANLLAEVGRLKESLAMVRRLRAIEPFVPVFNGNAATVMWLNGDDEAAIAVFKSMSTGPLVLPEVYAAAGRYDDAVDAILAIPAARFLPGTIENAVRLLRTVPATETSPQILPRLGILGFIYKYVGTPDRALEFNERNSEVGTSSAIVAAMLWHPSYSAIRKTERFKTYVRKAGLVDYWRARGWPDLCRPVGTVDFECN
jgi:TolB-like protein/DNA-binding SARP family transcriptional activator